MYFVLSHREFSHGSRWVAAGPFTRRPTAEYAAVQTAGAPGCGTVLVVDVEQLRTLATPSRDLTGAPFDLEQLARSTLERHTLLHPTSETTS